MLHYRSASIVLLLALATGSSCGSDTTAPNVTQPTVVVPAVPAAPPAPVVPLDAVAITIRSSGFVIDTKSPFPLSGLRVYQGARLTFTNSDIVPHDVLSDPPHIHNECPEMNTAGFLVPGQSRTTDPLNRIMTCGFHDHTHEGDDAFTGKVTIEPR
jgi:hypothetical protein